MISKKKQSHAYIFFIRSLRPNDEMKLVSACSINFPNYLLWRLFETIAIICILSQVRGNNKQHRDSSTSLRSSSVHTGHSSGTSTSGSGAIILKDNLRRNHNDSKLYLTSSSPIPRVTSIEKRGNLNMITVNASDTITSSKRKNDVYKENYMEQVSIPKFDYHSNVDANLEAYRIIIERTSGVYKPDHLNKFNLHSSLSAFQLTAINNTVVLTACNYAYLSFFHNFKCFLDRLGIKVLVFAMDERTYSHLIHLNVSTILWTQLLTAGESSLSGEGDPTIHRNKRPNHNHHHSSNHPHSFEAAHTFRSKSFNIISNTKMAVVEFVIGLGFHAIFIDPDIAVVRDPISRLIFEGIDYVHSVNQLCSSNVSKNQWDFYKSTFDGNTGFYFIQSNPRTRQLYKLFAKESLNWPRLDDQTVFWEKMLRSTDFNFSGLSVEPHKTCHDVITPGNHRESSRSSDNTSSENAANIIRTCHLDICQFSAGSVHKPAAIEELQSALAIAQLPLMTMHANWMLGSDAKIAAMKRYGFWIANMDERGQHNCSEFSLSM